MYIFCISDHKWSVKISVVIAKIYLKGLLIKKGPVASDSIWKYFYGQP